MSDGWSEVKLADVKPGDKLQLDDGFTCMDDWAVVTIQDDDGELFFECESGQHFLDGQLDFDGCLVGMRRPQ